MNSKGLYRRSRKEKESRCLVFTSCQREIRHFHVIVMQKQQRNVQKKRDAHRKIVAYRIYCFFAVRVAVFIVVA